MSAGSGRRLEHDWHTDPVPDNVEWGAHSWIYSAYAFRHCRSGRRRAVVIGSNTGVYHPSQFDLGPTGSVIIGDNSTLVSVIISTNGRVRIGDRALIAHGVVIAGDPVAVPGQGRSDSEVEIGDNVWVGTKSIILGGAVLGDNVVVGAGSVVDFPVPSGRLVAGNPARVVKDLA